MRAAIPSSQARSVCTIGHSTRTIETFVSILRTADVQMVVDVRTVPRSRTNPQYNLDTFPTTLAHLGLRYEHLPALGGLRNKSREIDPAVNAFWINDSFHNYADYALSDTFHDGLTQLRELARADRCAIMCSEAVWWRCHRRIITDYLLAYGDDVFHLLDVNHAEPGTLTPAARPRADGTLVYPKLP